LKVGLSERIHLSMRLSGTAAWDFLLVSSEALVDWDHGWSETEIPEKHRVCIAINIIPLQAVRLRYVAILLSQKLEPLHQSDLDDFFG
jgi:hypothetical protein